MSKAIDDITTRWQEYMSTPFPRDCGDDEIGGVSLCELDAFTGACIGTYVGSGGKLDNHNKQILGECARELRSVIGGLSGDAKAYFERLRIMAELVIREVGPPNA